MPQFTGVIERPGLYPEIPEHLYHADPVPESEGRSLSVTSSKLLLPPSPPAKFKYVREHGHRPSSAQKLGTLSHAMTLGTGTDYAAVLDFPNRSAKGYKAAEAQAIAAGKEPVLAKEWAEARAIADALLTHPTAGGLLEGIDPEVSMFWRSEEWGIWLRGRMDAMTLRYEMPTIVDVKTSKDASPDAFAKSVADYGYHRQDPWYREGLAACLGCDPDDIDFVFVVVETEAPYLVATYRIVPEHSDLGREQNRIAREIYADCTQSGIWPGYSEEIEDLELRRYDAQRIKKEVTDWHD